MISFMSSEERSLRQFLQLPGVTEETRAIVLALLSGCVNRNGLSVFILDNIATKLYGKSEEGRAHAGPMVVDVRNSELRHVNTLGDRFADALNDEASRWLAEFLMIGNPFLPSREPFAFELIYMLRAAIGRRECYGSTSASHPHTRPRHHERPWSSNGKLVQTLDLEVFLRDGHKCCVSGSVHSLVCVQLIPTSEDTDRLSRFRCLARAFFDEELPCIEDPVLRSTENAMLVTYFWKDRLDSGCLTFIDIDGELHASPMSVGDSDLLEEERRLNSIDGPTLLQLRGGVNQYSRALNLKLSQTHRTIVQTMHKTGLLGRMLAQIEYVKSIPPSLLSLTFLSRDEFARVLKHKLSLL